MDRSKALLTIVAVRDAEGMKDWLAVQDAVFSGDPAWVRPLDFMERRRVSRSHAPFLCAWSLGEFERHRFDNAHHTVSPRGGLPQRDCGGLHRCASAGFGHLSTGAVGA